MCLPAQLVELGMYASSSSTPKAAPGLSWDASILDGSINLAIQL